MCFELTSSLLCKGLLGEASWKRGFLKASEDGSPLRLTSGTRQVKRPSSIGGARVRAPKAWATNVRPVASVASVASLTHSIAACGFTPCRCVVASLPHKHADCTLGCASSGNKYSPPSESGSDKVGPLEPSDAYSGIRQVKPVAPLLRASIQAAWPSERTPLC